MARILTDGFEMGDFLSSPVNAGCNAQSTSGLDMSGNYCLRLAYNSSPYAKFYLSSYPTEFYIRFRFRYMAVPSTDQFIFTWYNGTTVLGAIKMRASTAKPFALVSTTEVAWSGDALSVNTTYVIEIHAKVADSGNIDMKVDNISKIAYAGDTKPASISNIDNVMVSCPGSAGNYAYFDDIAINDTSGITDNSWCGEGRIIAMFPDAAGDVTQLTNTSGTSTNNYLYVDDVPADGDTSYVEGSVVDEEDLYSLAASGLSGGTILRVWAESRSKDTVATGGMIALVIKPSGTNEWAGTDRYLLTTYSQRILGIDHYSNPNTSGTWTLSDLNSLQAGPRTRG